METAGHRLTPNRVSADAAQTALAAAFSRAELDPRLSYSDQLFSILRDAIVQGSLEPGAVLSEATISNVAGVSRTPVREALRTLALHNLVDIFPQVGTVVSRIRLSLIREGKFIRAALESENAAALVEVIQDDQMRKLKDLFEQQIRTLDKWDNLAFIALDDTMHRTMFEITGRPRIWSFINDAKVHTDRVRYFLEEIRSEEHKNRVIGEHRNIIERLEARDAEGLAKALHHHIDAVTMDAMQFRAQGEGCFIFD